MIKLEAFIEAIQGAILQANESLMDRGIDVILEKYFEPPVSESDLQSSLDNALDASKKVKDTESLKVAYRAIKDASKTLSGGNANQSRAVLPDSLQPKTVSIQYPIADGDEVETHEIQVPLLTLVPIGLSAIHKVKLKTDIEIHEHNGELELNFGHPTRWLHWFFRGKSTAGQLEITLRPDEGAEGLKILINGFEKTLRSQIPG